MELKQKKGVIYVANTTSSNWTFMELKRVQLNGEWNFINVLIEPLWNWNGPNLPIHLQGRRSNWTFMELKQSKWLVLCSREEKF